METNRYYASIATSDQLNGMTGDDGETFCLFVEDRCNPLASGWRWYHSFHQADTERMRIKARVGKVARPQLAITY